LMPVAFDPPLLKALTWATSFPLRETPSASSLRLALCRSMRLGSSPRSVWVLYSCLKSLAIIFPFRYRPAPSNETVNAAAYLTVALGLKFFLAVETFLDFVCLCHYFSCGVVLSTTHFLKSDRRYIFFCDMACAGGLYAALGASAHLCSRSTLISESCSMPNLSAISGSVYNGSRFGTGLLQDVGNLICFSYKPRDSLYTELLYISNSYYLCNSYIHLSLTGQAHSSEWTDLA